MIDPTVEKVISTVIYSRHKTPSFKYGDMRHVPSLERGGERIERCISIDKTVPAL
jgi:hypothetical protein